MELLCCRIVPSKVWSGIGHCARCVETDMHWDFVGSTVIHHLFPHSSRAWRDSGDVLIPVMVIDMTDSNDTGR